MKNRVELAEYFARLGFKTGAEIGVCKGHYSKTLCENIPGLKLTAIDAWKNISHTRRERIHRNSTRRQAFMNLTPFGATILKKTSMEAVKNVPDEALDFVFIDADHRYEFVRDDIREWTKKVKPGGIVSGHDYFEGSSEDGGVIQAVDEYVKEHNYELKLTEWDRDNPVGDNRQPSWYFFKRAGVAPKKTIQQLCVEYGCDKTPEIQHSYALIYDKLFSKLKNVKSVLEIGVGHPALMNQHVNPRGKAPVYDYKIGVSLYIWREYFPEAMVYGVDIHPDASVIGEDRIKTFIGNSTDGKTVEEITEGIAPFDIVIDDGSHRPSDQLKTAQHFLPHVKEEGMYFIEDVRDAEVLRQGLPERELEILNDVQDDRLVLIKT